MKKGPIPNYYATTVPMGLGEVYLLLFAEYYTSCVMMRGVLTLSIKAQRLFKGLVYFDQKLTRYLWRRLRDFRHQYRYEKW